MIGCAGNGDSISSEPHHTLLYCLGEEAEAVLTSTNVEDEERKVYNSVIKKVDDFFKVRKNDIY